MAWPTVAVITTGMDADTDSLPRSDILDLTSKFNELIAMRGIANGVCDLDASTLVPVARIPAAIARLAGAALTGTTSVVLLNHAVGANIASAATLNLTAATGNLIHVTGAVGITAVTLGAGMMRTVIFDGAPTLTHHATSNNLPGALPIEVRAGDRAVYWSDGTTVWCVTYARADGTAVAVVPGVPTGTISAFGGATAAVGYLECNGAAVSRTTYAALFTAISTVWGAGDGTTTFNVPDLRGRTPIGSGTGAGLTARALAASGGEESHVLGAGAMPPHTHGQPTVVGSGGATTPSITALFGQSDTYASTPLETTSTGGGAAHNNMQPFRAVMFQIKT